MCEIVRVEDFHIPRFTCFRLSMTGVYFCWRMTLKCHDSHDDHADDDSNMYKIAILDYVHAGEQQIQHRLNGPLKSQYADEDHVKK